MESSEPPVEATEALSTLEPRRNPKRKSSQVNGPALDLPEDLLTAAYEPLTDREREEWEGWVELESDPASFNHILTELGVKGVQVQELFSIDQDSLNLLPKPVHGLIFLFQYQPEHIEETETAQADNVWFANQTSHNACATVALLNIAMNIEGIQLGADLREFKAETISLSPPLRGDRITVNSFIRSKHNSFATRIDLLDADLRLENDVEAAERTSKRRTSPKKGKGKAGLRRGEEYAFHFIAYVAAHGSVWELDGLRPQPNRLGPATAIDWTTVATPQIEARMMQYAESQLAFNLLALCQTPLASHRQRIIESWASLRYIRSHMASNQDFERLISGEEEPLDVEDHAKLAQYELRAPDLEEAAALSSVVERLSNPSIELGEVYELYHSHGERARRAMGAYQAELSIGAEATDRTQTIKTPWSPAIHRLVTALAEKDALLGVVRNS